MFQPADAERGRKLIARWRILAERRLEHLIELYQSGRWKLYHEESAFLQMVQEARGALKAWEVLAPPDPVQDKPVEAAIAQAEGNLPEVDVGLANGVAAKDDLRKS